MTQELFANQPTTTVTSGGTTAPSSGTSETWTVASSASFPTAVSGSSQFRVADTATGKTSEIILVTNVSGASWTVTRGAEGTTPITHASGFTIYQVVSAGVLDSLFQSGGGTLTGPLSITEAPSSTTSGLPAGYGNSQAITGLQIASSYPSDDVDGGTDGTGRISLYSYQRADAYSFGETIRNFLMRWDSKAMTAWYGPNDLYDGGGNALNGGGWSPWTWVGSHYEANDHGSIHGHWEVEVPDSTGALQGRLAILFANTATGAIGLDKTTISTNLADLHVYCHGTDHTGTYQQQYLRLTGQAGYAKVMEWNNDNAGSAANRRWQVLSTADTETGSNAGTNWQLARFDDTGNQLDSPITISRQTGAITLGSSTATSGVTILRSGGIALTLTQSGAAASGLQATMADTSSMALGSSVSGDSSNRFAVYSDGSHQWGSGSASRDTNLYRSSVNVLGTDYWFRATLGLRINTTSAGGGAGVLAIGNATTAPSSTPSGGGVLYVSAGALLYKGSSGTVTTIASA
jgi:hypothetical protein